MLNQPSGNAWLKSPFEDVALDVVLTSGDILEYSVEYINGPAGGYALGDLNFDGAVSPLDWPDYHAGRGVDLSGMSAVEAYRRGDLDGDLDNDIADFVLVQSNWRRAMAPAAWSTLVPSEPDAAMLLLTAWGLFFSTQQGEMPGAS